MLGLERGLVNRGVGFFEFGIVLVLLLNGCSVAAVLLAHAAELLLVRIVKALSMVAVLFLNFDARPTDHIRQLKCLINALISLSILGAIATKFIS